MLWKAFYHELSNRQLYLIPIVKSVSSVSIVTLELYRAHCFGTFKLRAIYVNLSDVLEMHIVPGRNLKRIMILAVESAAKRIQIFRAIN
jgi:hypothetical protein